MQARRALFLGLALAVVQASAVVAQPAQPWTGIAADEARPIPFGVVSGGSEMSSRSISADGRFVVFNSFANLVPGDNNNATDVFMRDRQTGELRRVSVASDGAEGNNYSAFASISSNGRHIAFNSCATNFDPADTNNSCDLFIHDRELGTTVRANLGPSGEQSFYTTQHHFNLSADGRYFVFDASFDGAQPQVYLRDRDTDANGVFDEPGTAVTTLVSQTAVGSHSLWGYEDVAISPDGRWIAYNALTWDETGSPLGTRLYLYDRVAATTVRVDRAMAGGADMSAYSGGPDFSESGHLVYSSNADNLAEGDTDGNDDVYVYDIATGVNTPIELTHPGAPVLDAEWAPAISADGRYVAIMGVQWGQWLTLSNVYAVDRQTGLSYEISVWPDGSRDNRSGAPSISADGSAIAFVAGPEMLLNGWGNTGVFVATGVALSPSEIEVPAEGGTFTIGVTMPAGVAWTLNTTGAPGAEFSQTSGIGPGAIDVTLWENCSGQEQDFYVLLGSEQVVLHQTVRPQIWFVYPYEGGVAGGTQIEIYGQSFVDGATVTIDGTPATNVVVIDSENIIATSPAHAPGWASVTVTNPSGASATLEYAFFYRDLTPPVVTYEIAGTLGTNGWYTSDVWVNWYYEDPESTVFLAGCENPYRLLTDMTAFPRCSVTSEGGDTTVEVEVKRDSLPPVVALSPSVPQTYFQGEVVPIAQHCSDATSGIATCTLSQPGPNLDTSTVGTFELSLTGVDVAGHSTTTTTSYTVMVKPVINLPPATGVYGAGEYALLQAFITAFGSGAPLAGKSLTFFVDNIEIGSALTLATGEAFTPSPTVNYGAGAHVVRVEFAGDGATLPAIGFGDLTIAKATPVVTWANPAFIAHGTPLSGAQLNATGSVAGTFVYNPPLGTVLAPGTHTLTAQFTPQDAANYSTVTKTVTLKVKAVPVVTWATPAAVTYPTVVTGSQLNATANVAGSFVYAPTFGAVPPAGLQTLSVTFTPTNAADYVATTATVTLEVSKGTVTFNWPPVDPITYRTPLSSAQLNATTSAVSGSGTVTYEPPAGTILPAGTHTLTAIFTPNEPANYHPATTTKSLLVGQYPATVNWNTPAPMTWGTPLGPAQQNATVYPAELVGPGTWTYSPPPGTVMEVGTHWINVLFNPDDPNYGNGSYYVSLTVQKAPTTITWSNPAPIVYPDPLLYGQLNATASVPGTLNYSPALGTQLPAGTHTLSVIFNPTDSAHYQVSSKNVSIVVEKKTPVITWNNPAPITYGTALGWTQYSATVNVGGGFFQFTPDHGTVLNAGAGQTLSVTYFPPSNNYNSVSKSVTIDVIKASPVVTWGVVSPITYGTALSSTQLNATTGVPGTFAYSPDAGAVLPAGSHTLSMTFTPADAGNYSSVTLNRQFTVLRANAVLAWQTPAPITYGTPLSSVQLNATANTPGTLSYSHALGTVMPAGTHTLYAYFMADDQANYLPGGQETVALEVVPAAAVINWAAPAAIGYGTALSAAQLNATANVPGSFAYSHATGSVLTAGSHVLAATFTPQSSNYTTATSTVAIEVAKAAPVVTWNNPAGITYGTALSALQLNATTNVPGSFDYSPAAGSVLGAGTHTLSVTFTPTDGANHLPATATASISVAAATPVISWPAPSGIVYGTALSAAQLNATASVPGTFAYSPAGGTVLNAGTQPLSVTFTPNDSANYAAAATAVSIVVAKAVPIVSWSNPAGINYGAALSATQLNASANVPGSFAYSPAAGTVLGAGTHALSVTFTPADAVNYTSPSSAASITVARVPVTVRTTNASKVYGEALPAFTVTGTGFVNGDTVASLAGTPAFATSATATSAPGTYSVTPSGVSSPNYTITFATGTLTVTKAATSVAFTTTPNPSNRNQNVQLRAVVSPVAPGAGTPTGTVQFRRNGSLLGTATLVNGVATLTKKFSRGTYALTATYAGNTNFTTSSGAVTHQVP